MKAKLLISVLLINYLHGFNFAIVKPISREIVKESELFTKIGTKNLDDVLENAVMKHRISSIDKYRLYALYAKWKNGGAFLAKCLAIKGCNPYKVRRITKLEKKFIKSGKEVKFLGKVVVKRNFIFDSKAKDALGRTNIDRMKQGLAPIGKDGKPIELHHLKQQNDGKIVELLNTEHKNHSKILHRYTDKSEINRNEFNKWKKQYWKERAKDFE